jgi:magnesium transporter
LSALLSDLGFAVSTVLGAIPYLHAAELLKLCPDALAADAKEEMTLPKQLQIFEELDEDHGARLLALMAPDAATDLIRQLVPNDAQRYLERLPPQERERIFELLQYPDDTAGGIMTNDVIAVRTGLTVKQTRQVLRDQLQSPDFAYYAYVVEDEASRRLRGVLTLRDILMAEDSQQTEEIMNRRLEAIDPLQPAREAARHVVDNHLLALPVAVDGGRLIGAVTVDAAVAQLAPTGWQRQAPKVFS